MEMVLIVWHILNKNFQIVIVLVVLFSLAVLFISQRHNDIDLSIWLLKLLGLMKSVLSHSVRSNLNLIL